MAFSSSPASRISRARPSRRGWESSSSPSRTMVRFSPVIGITSATVPTAARSQYSASTSPSPSGPLMAMASFRATPTPARPLQALGQSLRRGSTTAWAAGRPLLHSWWSVMTTSIPRDRAQAVSSRAVMPQSTVTIREAPCSFRAVTASRFRP